MPSAIGGTPDWIYKLTGPIPEGLTFNPADRILSGTPTSSVEATLTYTVTDSAIPSATFSQTFMITVPTLPSIAAIPPQVYTVRVPVLVTLPQATGGISPYTYNIRAVPVQEGLAPNLLRDLTLDPTTGVLSGTPPGDTHARIGSANYRYIVTDALNQTGESVFMITVNPNMPIAPTGVSASAGPGDGEITVAWTAIPSFIASGGITVPVLRYTATAVDGATTFPSCIAIGA